MKKIIFILILFFCTTNFAQRGCCSWHGGVAGCQNGHVVCADGTLSPSCTCYNNDANHNSALSPILVTKRNANNLK